MTVERNGTPMWSRVLPAAMVLALTATAIGGLALPPTSALAMGPLPACRYADLLTSPRAYGD